MRQCLRQRRFVVSGILLLSLMASAGNHCAARPLGKAHRQTTAPREIRTLADLLPKAVWDPVTRGPLLIVDPEGTRRLRQPSPGDSKNRPALAPLPPATPDGRRNLRLALPAFDRQVLTTGSLSVIAPLQMVVLSDKTPTRPNLWAGMRPDEKLAYVLSTLSPDQWARIGGGTGLSASDLSNPDAREAFLSLLPTPFAYREGVVDEKGNLPDNKPVTLTEAERARVRLRMSLTPSFQIPVSKNGYTETSPWFRGMPGDHVAERDDEGDFDRKEAFGAALQMSVPNRPRPSDIDYASPALGAAVSLSGIKTLGELVTRSGAAVGMELFADFRVAGLTVENRGNGGIRAGDLLKALALAVCGTWRRVDTNTYVLTADRTGAGARKLRLAEWQADLDQKKQRQVTEWHRSIAKNGGYTRSISYAADDPLAPPDALATKITVRIKARFDDPKGFLSPGELTPAMREFLRQNAAMYSHQSGEWDQTRVHVEPTVVARFVLPNGTTLIGRTSITIGPASFFEPEMAQSLDVDALDAKSLAAAQARLPGPFPPFALRSPGPSLFLPADSIPDAERAVRLAQQYGFSALYLATDRREVVEAALRARVGTNLPVSVIASLFQGKFTEGTPAESQDRNLLGENGGEAAAARVTAARWKEYVDTWRRSTFPRPKEALLANLPGSTVSPTSPLLEARVQQLTEIAALPGLAGLALTHPMPLGYAGKRPAERQGGYDAPFSIRTELGYSPALRHAFLRKEGVDPIDLIPEGLRFSADLRQPFFLDDNARGDSTVYDGRNSPVDGFAEKNAAWDAFRGEQNRAVLARVRAALEKAHPGLPVWITRLPEHLPIGNDRDDTTFALWANAPEPPRITRNEARSPLTEGGQNILIPLRFSHPMTESESWYAGVILRGRFNPTAPPPGVKLPPSFSFPFALDLTEMPLDAADAFLAKWLLPAK